MNLENGVGMSDSQIKAMNDQDCMLSYMQAGLHPAGVGTDKDGDPVFYWDAPEPGTPEYELLATGKVGQPQRVPAFQSVAS